MERPKTHNTPSALIAKVGIRHNVLRELGEPARVFEAFCGPQQVMHVQAWQGVRGVASWTGCDLAPFKLGEPYAPRFVADNRRVLRCLDLSAFNVFDFDAFGSPWEQMLILASRRRWKPGERGAVVLTDGSSLKARWGGTSAAQALLMGMDQMGGLPATTAGVGEQFEICLSSWMKRARVTPLKRWDALGRGSTQMRYSAIVFKGSDV